MPAGRRRRRALPSSALAPRAAVAAVAATTLIATVLSAAALTSGALASPRPVLMRTPQALADTIAIVLRGPVRAGSAYNVAVAGTAHRRSTVYVFVDYQGCARTVGAERRRTGEHDAFAVLGAFTETTGWASSGRGVDHACAYLVSSGHVVASARRTFRVR